MVWINDFRILYEILNIAEGRIMLNISEAFILNNGPYERISYSLKSIRG